MEDYDEKYESTGVEDAVLGLRLLHGAAEEVADDYAARNREEHDLEDGDEHREQRDVNPGSREEVDEERRYERREERGAGSDGDGERHIALREEAHDVRGGAARAAADEDHAGGDFGRKREGLAEEPRGDRHDDKLPDDADEDLKRPPEHLGEVSGLQGEAHAEHHYSEKDGDIACERREDRRKEEGESREDEDPYSEGPADKRAESGQRVKEFH